jgi:anti-sigma B factor antagonist
VATRYDPPDGQADLLGTYDRLTSGLGGSIPLIATGSGGDLLSDHPDRLLHLTIERLAAGVCVVVVAGELDMLTAPLLERCLFNQLAVTSEHLIVDLQPVRFLGLNGLTCLLQACRLTQRSPGTQLHLSGLVNRMVRRALDVTGVRGLFDSYPTLADARAAVGETAGSLTVDPPPAPAPRAVGDPTECSPPSVPDNITGPAVLAAVWCSSAATNWILELRQVASDDPFGALVDSINSGVPVSQPAPHALVAELVETRGFWLFCESPSGPHTRDRYHFGYVSTDNDP